MEVKVYTSPTCGYCHQAKSYLASCGVRFTEHDVSRDKAAAEEMVRLTGQMAVPVIVVDGQIIVGFDRSRMERLLDRADGSSQRPRFGLKVADASRVAQHSSAVPVFGALVGAVAPSSLGERAGLRAGDIITGINMERISSADDLEQALGGLTSDSPVTITFLRGQETLRTEIFI